MAWKKIIKFQEEGSTPNFARFTVSDPDNQNAKQVIVSQYKTKEENPRNVRSAKEVLLACGYAPTTPLTTLIRNFPKGHIDPKADIFTEEAISPCGEVGPYGGVEEGHWLLDSFLEKMMADPSKRFHYVAAKLLGREVEYIQDSPENPEERAKRGFSAAESLLQSRKTKALEELKAKRMQRRALGDRIENLQAIIKSIDEDLFALKRIASRI